MPTAERETFIKVSDHMPDHPKIVGLSDKAFRALVTLWCYCSRNRTDGVVPAAVWRRDAPGRAGRELVEAGLAEAANPRGPAQMHDYLKHQRSKEHIEAVSSKRAEAGQKGGKKRPPRKQTSKQFASDVPSKDEASLTPEDRGGTTYPPAREADGSAPTERPEPGADTDEVAELAINKQAQAIAKEYTSRVPLSRFPAVFSIVKRAVKSGRYSAADLSAALVRMAEDNRSVTIDALRIELEGFPMSRAQPRTPTSNERAQDALSLAARYQQQELEQAQHHQLETGTWG